MGEGRGEGEHNVISVTYKKWALPRVFFLFSLVLFCFALSGCEAKKESFHIGVLQWTEKIEPYNETWKGVLDGLNEKGYWEGINLSINYKNVNRDNNLALEAARSFVRDRVDVIVALGTGSALAALKATEKREIPIVFSIVGAPIATGIIKDSNQTGRNITGVSMKVPMKEQFALVKEALPGLRKLGILYCTKMPQAVANGKEAAACAPEFGWTPVTVSFPKEDLPQLRKMVESLAQKVGAVYLPTDPVLKVPENMQTIMRISDEHGVPLVTVAKQFVEDGALMAVHCDFYDIGRQAADSITKVLEGCDVRDIPAKKPAVTMLSLSLKKARALNINLNRNIILKADNLFD